ncbi:hypothetical protein AGMMS50229_08180 [Campylobacterota bacterium]|nr:hypothetical protein AGMMS50229_08180 [Campylobacterota bacterium]
MSVKQRFYSSLKRGTGEAYLILQEYPKIDFSRYIAKAVTQNYAYNGQSERDRARYIYDLIALANQQDKYRDILIESLHKERRCTWNLTHLFALALIYAKNGDQKAKEAIKNNFLANPIEDSDWVGYAEILELEGIEGLKLIAEKFGKRLAQNRGDWQDDTIIGHFKICIQILMHLANSKNLLVKIAI